MDETNSTIDPSTSSRLEQLKRHSPLDVYLSILENKYKYNKSQYHPSYQFPVPDPSGGGAPGWNGADASATWLRLRKRPTQEMMNVARIARGASAPWQALLSAPYEALKAVEMSTDIPVMSGIGELGNSVPAVRAVLGGLGYHPSSFIIDETTSDPSLANVYYSHVGAGLRGLSELGVPIGVPRSVLEAQMEGMTPNPQPAPAPPPYRR